MREHKYRAWDKQQQRMIAVSNLHFGDDGSGRTITLQYKSPEGYAKLLVMGENAELMEYTGLKDKHGVEICEGDILRERYASGETLYKTLIGENTQDIDGLDFPYSGVYFELIRSATYRACDSISGLGYPSVDEMEIIGNIYEHPDLVEAQP